MTTFDTAKISSIDRIKGRIGLSMRNGLESVGTYPYDIADLREGMSVLIGKVDNSHVILNQIENIPRSGTSYSVRRPVVETGQLLILNFEGEDGATSWIEEAQGLVPDITPPDYILDTSKYKFGSSSLLISAETTYLNLEYRLPIPISEDFTLHGWVNVTNIANYVPGVSYSLLYMEDDTNPWGKAVVYVTLGGPTGEYIQYYIQNYEGNVIYYEGVTEAAFLENVWHHVAVTVWGQSIYYAFDGIILHIWNAGIDAPCAGLNRFIIANTDDFNEPHVGILSPVRYDAFELVNYAKWTSNFTPPTHAPVLGVITV